MDEGTFVIGRRDRGLLAASDCGGLAAELAVWRRSCIEAEQQAYGATTGSFEDGWKTVDKVLNPRRKREAMRVLLQQTAAADGR